MRYSGLILNDITAAPGLCVSFFTQGCPHHCPGCHNPGTWAFDGGKEFTNDTLHKILEGLTAQGIKRNLCIMGGEPLAWENRWAVMQLIMDIKLVLPDTPIYIWTGYTYEELQEEITSGLYPETELQWILEHIDVLIDGPYIQEQRDTTLLMRGSRNQRILHLVGGKILNEIK